jgi:4-carboxymuconolactone decarboxylase
MSEHISPQVPAGNERFSRGIEILRRIGGDGYDRPMKRLAEVAPDLARFMVEFCYGDVLSRESLDLPTRQLVTVASLMAQGSVQPQLKFHMIGYLNAGGDPAVLIELLVLAAPILGFTVAINTVTLVREIFRERGISVETTQTSDDGTARSGRGLRVFRELAFGPENLRALQDISPEFMRWSVEFLYGEVLSRTKLPAGTRQLAIIAMLATSGDCDDALRRHISAGLRVGLSQREITEALMQLSVYAGFPTVLNALAIAGAAFSEKGENTVKSATDEYQPWVSESRSVRNDRGLATLSLTSAETGASVVNSFDDIAPDIGHAIVEHAYGDIFSRPGLDPKTRELAACSALAAVGTKSMETPLRVHINAALTAGAARLEIIETLLNLTPYCGYPTVERALRIAAEELAKRRA